MRQGAVPAIKTKIVLGIIILFSLLSCQPQIDPRELPYNWPAPDPESPLIGTMWIYSMWGDQTIYFETAETVVFQGVAYAYSYDREIRSGQADYLGRFNVTEDYQRMNFSYWINFGHSADFLQVKN